VVDSRTRQSSPERGRRAGYDGHKKRTGSKGHLAVDTLGHLLTLLVTPANAPERAQVAALAAAVPAATGDQVAVACVDQGYPGAPAAADAAAQGSRLDVVKLPAARKGFVLLPRRWVVERSNAWVARLRRLARDYERLPETLKGGPFLAFAIVLLTRFVVIMAQWAYQALAPAAG
jgi:transposase